MVAGIIWIIILGYSLWDVNREAKKHKKVPFGKGTWITALLVLSVLFGFLITANLYNNGLISEVPKEDIIATFFTLATSVSSIFLAPVFNLVLRTKGAEKQNRKEKKGVWGWSFILLLIFAYWGIHYLSISFYTFDLISEYPVFILPIISALSLIFVLWCATQEAKAFKGAVYWAMIIAIMTSFASWNVVYEFDILGILFVTSPQLIVLIFSFLYFRKSKRVKNTFTKPFKFKV